MTLAGVRYFRTVEADESFDFFATKCEVVPFGKNNLISYGSYLGYIYSSNSRDCQQLPAPVVTGTSCYWHQLLLAPVVTGTSCYWHQLLLAPTATGANSNWQPCQLRYMTIHRYMTHR